MKANANLSMNAWGTPRSFVVAVGAAGLLLAGVAAANTIERKGPVPSGGLDGIYEPVSPERQVGKKALLITDFGFNDMETFYPLYRFTEEGYEVTVASIHGGAIQGYGGHVVLNTKPIAEVNVKEYDILYLPGGRAPATLRQNDHVVAAVKAFAQTGRPIGAVCHGPQILVTAGLVDGKRIACYEAVGDEVEAAGGSYVDQPVAIDGQFITSRLPKDLPIQMQTILKRMAGDLEGT
jgi:protease I